MGTYDTIVYTCPYCNKETQSQTKLIGCNMDTIKKGEAFMQKGTDMNLILKESCRKCGCFACAIIIDGVIISFGKQETATHLELEFGQLKKIKKIKL